MRLRQIEIFHAVYANGSISSAARALNVSQPAVSKVLRHTEGQLGIKLFDLVRGRLVPTDEAHALFREVDEVFHRVSSLQLTARNLRNSGAGHLRVGIVPSLGLEVLPQVVAAFRTKSPEVTFDIKTIHHSDILRSLYERECDIAFGYDPPVHPRLARKKLASAQLVVIAPQGKFAHSRRQLSVADIREMDLIGVSSSGPIGDIVAAAHALAQIDFREVASVDTYYIAAALVRHGSGVAIVDEFTARATASPGVELYPLTPELTFDVHAAWLEDRPLSKLAERFVDMMKAALRKGADLPPKP
ncbi:LysR family transcriptional regulator [Novosphingobium sp. B 225]|uniref:LysR family transcriptional regulator n=1 Tax=Novosphingobium sp. B 225 TaxID=1961849 RepID=UPI001595EA23|nr:LysR family transcriptional regulator [Novosphingobium sp. B 225]